MYKRILILLFVSLIILLPYLWQQPVIAMWAISILGLGGVFLTAYVLGRLAQRIDIPASVAGFGVGLLTTSILWQWLGVPSNWQSALFLQPLHFLYDTCLALIILYISRYFHFRQRLQVESLLWMLFPLILTMGAVFGVIMLCGTFFPALIPAGIRTSGIIYVGAAFGAVLMSTTSPSTTHAIIHESESEGTATDLILQAVVLKNVAAILIMGGLFYLFSGEPFGIPFQTGALFGQIGMSILTGLLFGLGVMFIERYFPQETLIVLTGGILALALHAIYVHHYIPFFQFDPILSAFVAGVVLVNTGKQALIDQLKPALPILYLMFFVLLAHQLELSAVPFNSVLLLSILIILIRVCAIFTGGYLAARLLKKSAAFRRNAWAGFLPQGEFILVLAMAWLPDMPQLQHLILPIGMSGILLNLTGGGILFRGLLPHVGETRERRSIIQDEPSRIVAEPTAPEAEPVTRVEYAQPQSSSSRMNEALLDLREAFQEIEHHFRNHLLHPRTSEQKAAVEKLHKWSAASLLKLGSVFSGDEQTVGQLKEAIRANRIDYTYRFIKEIDTIRREYTDTESLERFARNLLNDIDTLSELGKTYLVNQNEARFTPQPGDSPKIRVLKALKRIRRELYRLFNANYQFTHIVPLQPVIKFVMSRDFPEKFLFLMNLIGYQRLFMLQKSQIIFEEMIASNQALLLYLDGITGETLVAEDLKTYLENLRKELRETYEFTRTELDRLEADISEELHRVLVETYNQILRETEIVGTVERPAKSFNFSQIYAKSERKKAEITENIRNWRNIHQGFCGRFSLRMEIVLIEGRVRNIVDETNFNIRRNTSSQFKQFLMDAKQHCQTSMEAIVKAYTIDRHHWMHTVQAERDELLDLLQHRTVQKIANIPTTTRLESLVDIMLRRFHELSGKSPDAYPVVDSHYFDLNERTLPDTVVVQYVPLRETVRSFLEIEFTRSLGDVSAQIREEAEKISQMVVEATRVIEFNLGAAIEEFAALPDDAEIDFGDLLRETSQFTSDPQPEGTLTAREAIQHVQKLAIGGIKAVISRLDELIEEVDAFNDQLAENIIQKAAYSVRRLGEKLTQFGSKQGTVLIPEDQNFRQWMWITTRALNRQRERLENWWETRYGHPPAPVSATELQHQRIEQRLREIQHIHPHHLNVAQTQHLSFIYQRLFSFKPLEIEDFLIGRESELATIQLLQQHWLNGAPVNIAIVGEKGSGKTSLINIALKTHFTGWTHRQVIFTETVRSERELAAHLAQALEIAPTDAPTLETIRTHLLKLRGQQVFVVEHLHKLYLKKIGGFAVLNSFLHLVQETQSHVLWITSIHHYAWDYLQHASSLAAFFNEPIFVDTLSATDIRRAIEVRHTISGKHLEFTSPETAPAPSWWKFREKSVSPTESEEQKKIQFFNRLADIADGNIFIALYVWLHAITNDETDENRLRAVEPVMPQVPILEQLDWEPLLTLGAIAQHGTLQVEELAEIFAIDRTEATALLAELHHHYLIYQPTPPAHGYSLNPIVYRQIIRKLQQLNILSYPAKPDIPLDKSH